MEIREKISEDLESAMNSEGNALSLSSIHWQFED